jgi:hypothetical protein
LGKDVACCEVDGLLEEIVFENDETGVDDGSVFENVVELDREMTSEKERTHFEEKKHTLFITPDEETVPAGILKSK